MGASQRADLRRKIRKAFGPEAMEIVTDAAFDGRAFRRFFQRGFFGRLKWLLFGR